MSAGKIKKMAVNSLCALLPSRRLRHLMRDMCLAKRAEAPVDWRNFSNMNSSTAENINFFKMGACNSVNNNLINAAMQGDFSHLLQHICAQDTNHPEEFFDEIFSNRYGLQKIFKMLSPPPPPLVIIDIACGNAAILKELLKIGHDVIGVDISPVRIIKNQSSIRKLYLGFAERLPVEDEIADVIIATEALEHVFDLDKTLRECYRTLKKEGRIFIQVPLGKYADGTNHLRYFNEDIIRFCLEERGFVVRSIEIIPYLVGNEATNIFVIGEKHL